MAEQQIIEIVRKYLDNLRQAGLETRYAVLFGSYAAGHGNAWSDIDVVVVSPHFDSTTSRDIINMLWRIAARTDARIEPIPCGEEQWKNDDGTPILEAARREGVTISPL